MAGIPIEALLAGDDSRRSATLPRPPYSSTFASNPGPIAMPDSWHWATRCMPPAASNPLPDHAIRKGLAKVREGDEPWKPLPGSRYEVDALVRLFKADDRPARPLLDAYASEPELDRLVAAGELSKAGFIHLATHGVIDERVPVRSALILTQTGLPDLFDQVMQHKPAYDGRLSVREIQRGWDLKAELVTLSACGSGLGRDSGGEGFVGFTQALLMSGARSVCLSIWKVDDTATALLMQRFYANLLGRRAGLIEAMPKAEACGKRRSGSRAEPRKGAHSDREALGWRRAWPRGEGPPACQGDHRSSGRRRRRGPSVRVTALLGRVRADGRSGLIAGLVTSQQGPAFEGGEHGDCRDMVQGALRSGPAFIGLHPRRGHSFVRVPGRIGA